MQPLSAAIKIQDDCTSQVQEILDRSSAAEKDGKIEEALFILEESLLQPIDEKCKAIIKLEIGLFGNRNNYLVLAVEYLINADNTFAEYDMAKERITANNIIGGCYYILGEYNNTAKYTLKAINIAKKQNLIEELDILYNNLAGAYSPLGEYDSALKYTEMAIDLAKKKEGKLQLIYALSTKAELQLEFGKYEAAAKQFLAVLKFSKDNNIDDAYVTANCFRGLSLYYLTQKDYFKALKYGRASLKLAAEDGHLQIAQDVTKALSEIWKLKKNTDSAYYYLSLYIDYQDKIKPSKYLSELNRLELKEADKRLLAKELQAEQQKFYILAGIIILCLLLLLILGIFLYYKNSKKLNKKLTEQNKTIEKTNVQLAEQRDTLDQLNKLKDNIFSAVMHDFKTPLNTLEGMLNLLVKKYMTPEEVVENAKRMLKDLNKSRFAINSTIAWIKTQFEGYRVQNQTIRLSSFLKEIKNYHISDLEKKKIKLKTTYTTDFDFLSDRELLFIILNNLLTNAIKFSSFEKQIEIRVREENKRLKFTVIDAGIGMNQSELENIFSFEKGPKKGTASEVGSGLGLKITNQLLSALGGSLVAKSKIGVGTEVSFFIPLQKVEMTKDLNSDLLNNSDLQ